MRKPKPKRLASILALSVFAMALQGCIGEEELQDCNEEIAAFGPLHDTVFNMVQLGRFRLDTYEASLQLQEPWWWMMGERNRRVKRAGMTQYSLHMTSKYFHRPQANQPSDQVMIEYFLTGAATMRCQRHLTGDRRSDGVTRSKIIDDFINDFARSEFGLDLQLEPRPN